MALEPALRQTLEWVAQAFRDYAETQGWGEGDYRVFVRINPDWGQVHVVLAAKDFPGVTPLKQWSSVMDFLDERFRAVDDPRAVKSVSLTLRTFDQIEENGVSTLSPQFVDVEDVLGRRTVGPSAGSAFSRKSN